MDPTFAELETDAEWDEAVPILAQLWSHVDPSVVRSWRDEPGYRPFGLSDDGELVAVAGVSIRRVLHHARQAWIHDLVVDEAHRSEGYGSEVLDRIARWARQRDCEYVALANRLGNEDALRFYEANGMERWGYVVETEL